MAVAYDLDETYATEQDAVASGEDFLIGRDTQWDDREAIIFLGNNRALLPSSKQADRYAFSALRLLYEDHYTIASRHVKDWLPEAGAHPAAGIGGAVLPAGDEQRFLLDVPSDEGARSERNHNRRRLRRSRWGS